MTRLTVEEMVTVQESIDEKIDRAEMLGLSMHVDDDLQNWKRHIENVPGGTGASKTLDPAINDVRPGNSFWVYLKDANDRIVVCHSSIYAKW